VIDKGPSAEPGRRNVAADVECSQEISAATAEWLGKLALNFVGDITKAFQMQ
jgi:hypothetical protein